MILPEKNAEGLAPFPLTEEQKYKFDTRGWLLLPGVLTESEVAEMRDFCYRLKCEPASIPPHERGSYAGPLAKLTDHPALVGFMNEFVADRYANSPEGYGFRLESSFLSLRSVGEGEFSPHGGSGVFNYPVNSHIYFSQPGLVYSGLTRAVWELNPVQKGDGGTLFLTGSHKAAFPMPASVQDKHSPLWEDYDCPAGSLLFFTEGITHTGTPWSNPGTDRVAIFNCYNSIGSKWHNWNPNPDALAALHPLRRSLFRQVCCDRNDGRPAP